MADTTATQKYRHADFSGGQNDNLNATLIKDNEASVLENATIDFNGTLYPANACPARYAAAFSASGIQGLGVYPKANGTVYVLAAIGTTLYYDTADNVTPAMNVLASTFTASDSWCFVTFMDKLYICNGKDHLKVWDGVTLSEVNIQVFLWLEVHYNSLWGVEADSYIYFSDALDASTWNPLNSISFNPEDGDDIIRIQRSSANLMVYKTKSKAVIVGDRATNFSLVVLEGDGICGSHATDIFNSFIYYANPEGVKVYNMADDIVVSTQREKYWLAHCNMAAIDHIAVKRFNNYILFAVPMDSTKHYNTEVWVYNTTYRSWITITGFNISAWDILNINGVEQLIGSSATSGQIYNFIKNGAILNSAGVYMQYKWRGKNWHFGFPEKLKLFKNLFIEIEGIATESTLVVNLYTDNTLYPIASTIPIVIPAGAGADKQIRLIPPMYGAVMGTTLSVKLEGRVGIKSISIEFAVRSTIPPGSVI